MVYIAHCLPRTRSDVCGGGRQSYIPHDSHGNRIESHQPRFDTITSAIRAPGARSSHGKIYRLECSYRHYSHLIDDLCSSRAPPAPGVLCVPGRLQYMGRSSGHCSVIAPGVCFDSYLPALGVANWLPRCSFYKNTSSSPLRIVRMA